MAIQKNESLLIFWQQFLLVPSTLLYLNYYGILESLGLIDFVEIQLIELQQIQNIPARTIHWKERSYVWLQVQILYSTSNISVSRKVGIRNEHSLNYV
jgi:hypothetical protein